MGARAGLQMRCPPRVAQALRDGGWVGVSGYWQRPGDDAGAVRWWDALARQLRPSTSQTMSTPRCRRTADLFGPEAA